MKIYVYRVSNHEYGVGFGRYGCEKRGEIVEEWSIDSPNDAKFVASHGTAYWGASEKVSKLADLMGELLALDPTFLEQPPSVIGVAIDRQTIRIGTLEKPKARKRWFSWLPWLKTAGETT